MNSFADFGFLGLGLMLVAIILVFIATTQPAKPNVALHRWAFGLGMLGLAISLGTIVAMVS